MTGRAQPMKACQRCGIERVVRYDRRNYCQECRSEGLRPMANWMEHGACRNPNYVADWWWPETSDPEASGTRIALNICAYCPVRDLCLDYAIQHKERHGIWGGLLPAARAALAAHRRRKAG